MLLSRDEITVLARVYPNVEVDIPEIELIILRN